MGVQQGACQVGAQQGACRAGVAQTAYQPRHSEGQERIAEESLARQHRKSAGNRLVHAGSASHSAATLYSSQDRGTVRACSVNTLCWGHMVEQRSELLLQVSVTARSHKSVEDSSKSQEREAPVACQDGKEAEDPTPASHAAFAGADTLTRAEYHPGSNARKDRRNPKHP